MQLTIPGALTGERRPGARMVVRGEDITEAHNTLSLRGMIFHNRINTI